MNEFIKYLLVTDQLDEVFFGKEKSDDKENENLLKRTLEKKEENK